MLAKDGSNLIPKTVQNERSKTVQNGPQRKKQLIFFKPPPRRGDGVAAAAAAAAVVATGPKEPSI